MSRKLAKLWSRGNHSTLEPGGLVQLQLDRRADPDFGRQGPFGPLDATDLHHFSRLDFIHPCPAQCRGVEEDISLNLVTGDETITAQCVKPFHNRTAKRGIDPGIGMETPWPGRSLLIATGHFDDFNRLPTFVAFDSFANYTCVGQCGPLTKSSETTCMEEDVPQSVSCVDKSISACRIIPFYAAFETNNLCVVEYFMSQNHNFSLA
nr:hypothetical protein [Maricaulis sp.]